MEKQGPLRTLKLTLAYDGTDFHGWARQPGLRTVEGALSEACVRVLRSAFELVGASRTDRGVHALGQVASLETRSPMPCRRLLKALNSVLPEDPSVLRVEEAPPGFNARFAARAKLYRYRILASPTPHPLERRYSWHVPFPLDEARMSEGGAALVGTHDYASFARADEERSTVRTLLTVDVARSASIITIDVRGDGFLHNMVRAIAGTLVEVGRGRFEVAAVRGILAARDRSAAGPTAPAHGLFLVEVVY